MCIPDASTHPITFKKLCQLEFTFLSAYNSIWGGMAPCHRGGNLLVQLKTKDTVQSTYNVYFHSKMPQKSTEFVMYIFMISGSQIIGNLR